MQKDGLVFPWGKTIKIRIDTESDESVNTAFRMWQEENLEQGNRVARKKSKEMFVDRLAELCEQIKTASKAEKEDLQVRILALKSLSRIP